MKKLFYVVFALFFFTTFTPQASGQWNSMPGQYAGNDIAVSFSTAMSGGFNVGLLSISGTSQWNGLTNHFLNGQFWGNYNVPLAASSIALLADISLASMNGCEYVNAIFFWRLTDGTTRSVVKKLSTVGGKETVVLDNPGMSGTIESVGLEVLAVSSVQSFVNVSVYVDFIRLQNDLSGSYGEIESFGDPLADTSDDGAVLTDFNLYQNYPNPFNPMTVLKFSSSQVERITLRVYDAFGQEVVELVNEEKPAGEYSVVFNAQDFSSGTYCYVLTAGNRTISKKMVLLK